MKEPYRTIQIGFGSIGKMVAEAIMERPNLALESIVDINPELVGKSVADFCSVSGSEKITISSDFDKAIVAFTEQKPDIALILTASSIKKVAPTIEKCLEANLNVISICEELSYPFTSDKIIADEIDSLAKEHGRTVLGTGINPGYLMDLLPIVLTAPVLEFHRAKVTRVIDSVRRRKSFQKKIGTGMSINEFAAAIESGNITGHVGLVESIELVNDALQLNLEEIRELPPEAVIAEESLETPIGDVYEGEVKGLRSVGQGIKNGEVIIELVFIAYCGAMPEYDEVRIDGHPSIHQQIEGGVMGDYATIAMMLNMIPLVVNAEPGLLTMKDLPCPRNTENYWKN